MPCTRTQHGLTRVGLEPPTSGGINHQATALPFWVCKYTMFFYCNDSLESEKEFCACSMYTAVCKYVIHCIGYCSRKLTVSPNLIFNEYIHVYYENG